MIKSHLFIFALIYFALGDWPKKVLLWFMSDNILCMFFLGVLWHYVLYLRLSAILSLFLCVVWGGVLTSLIDIWMSSFPNTTCWKDCLFSLIYSCFLCQRLIDHRHVSLILVSLSCCLDRSVFVPVPCCLFTVAWQNCLKSGHLCFFAQDCFDYSRSFMLPYTF